MQLYFFTAPMECRFTLSVRRCWAGGLYCPPFPKYNSGLIEMERLNSNPGKGRNTYLPVGMSRPNHCWKMGKPFQDKTTTQCIWLALPRHRPSYQSTRGQSCTNLQYESGSWARSVRSPFGLDQSQKGK